MPVNLSVKNVPDDVVRGLRNRAAANEHTLNEELLEILKQAAKDQSSVTIDGLIAKAQSKKPALDERASMVLAAQEAEQQKAAQRFEDLLSRPDPPAPGGHSGS